MKKVTENSFRSQYSDKELTWSEVSSQHVGNAKIFDINLHRRKSTDGREGDFVELSLKDWVSVIPCFTGSDGKLYFVMERQFRHGSKKVTVEFPGGIIEKGENPCRAGFRELLEETGIKAHNIVQIGQISPNSAFMGNTQNVCLATDLEDLGTRALDDNEQIDVVTVRASEVLNNLGSGEYDNGIMMMAAYCFLKEKKLICSENI